MSDEKKEISKTSKIKIGAPKSNPLIFRKYRQPAMNKKTKIMSIVLALLMLLALIGVLFSFFYTIMDVAANSAAVQNQPPSEPKAQSVEPISTDGVQIIFKPAADNKEE